jgi:hypothetical protein
MEIPYWIAHSTLLGWNWGMKILPWENQIEIQLPANILYDLSTFDGKTIENEVRVTLNYSTSLKSIHTLGLGIIKMTI